MRMSSGPFTTGPLLVTAVVALGMFAAVACAKPSEEPLSQTTTAASVRALASCDAVATSGSCRDYSSTGGAFHLERSFCGAAHGTFALHACSTAGQVGTCVLEDSEVKRYYHGGAHGFTAERAQADCETHEGELRGRFVASPVEVASP